jgi:hypothetical protein
MMVVPIQFDLRRYLIICENKNDNERGEVSHYQGRLKTERVFENNCYHNVYVGEFGVEGGGTMRWCAKKWFPTECGFQLEKKVITLKEREFLGDELCYEEYHYLLI